ncbi:uncharacterized protein LOC144922692 isoform X3 [Branchiostoma floridae x Branchiostoma belcheri]
MGRAWVSKIYGQLVHGKGLLASLVAAVGFTVSPVLSRRAADVGVPGFQLVLVNELCKFAMFVPLALVFRAPLRGKDWKQTVLMIANGGLRALGGTLLVLSVILIPPELWAEDDTRDMERVSYKSGSSSAHVRHDGGLVGHERGSGMAQRHRRRLPTHRRRHDCFWRETCPRFVVRTFISSLCKPSE